MTGNPCEFVNRNGHVLRGLFFDPPPASPSRLGLVYLPGFVLGYTAVHRLALELLSGLAEHGYPGYVFDHAGVGESDGETLCGSHEALTRHVVGGGLLDDTIDALAHFRSARGVERLVLIGHCGGAITASYAASADPSVAGLILLSPPVMPVGEPSLRMPEEAANQRLRFYLAKVTSGRSWARLAFGQTDYRTLARTLWSKLMAKAAPAPAHAFNTRLMAAIRAVGKRGRVLLVVGDHDEEIREISAMMAVINADALTFKVLPDTSHGFVTDESLGRLKTEVEAFVPTVVKATGPGG